MKKNFIIAIIVIITICAGAYIFTSIKSNQVEKIQNNRHENINLNFPILTSDACEFTVNVDIDYIASPLTWNEIIAVDKLIKIIAHRSFAVKASELTASKILENKEEYWNEVYKNINKELYRNDIILFSMSGDISENLVNCK